MYEIGKPKFEKILMMQNVKMEVNEQQTTQQNSGTAIQVMPTVLGTANGQQILLQSLQQTLGGNGQQAIQVVPIQALGQGGTIIVQPQAQAPQPQIVQLPDGQTFIYQPMIPETQAQPQIVNINGNFFQIPAQQSTQTASIQSSPANPSQNQQSQQVNQVVMMTTSQQQPASTTQNETQNAVTNIMNTAGASPPPPSSSSPTPLVESEEEPLYVNASKFIFNKKKRIIINLYTVFHCII